MLINKFVAVAATTMMFTTVPAVADSVESAPFVVTEDGAQEADTLIYTVRLRMPYGNSVWTDLLRQESSSGTLKLRALVEPSCRVPRIAMYVRSSLALNSEWVRTTQAGDLDIQPLSKFDEIKFEIQQPYLVDQVCEIRLYAAGGNAPAPGPVWGPGVLSGGAEYNGGFAASLEVNISSATRIKGFRIDIPDFCSDAEILEAGTITEGNYDAATLIDADKGLYQVATGSVRASRIVFSMNGPFDSRCFVPVYTYAAQ
jgi:hypothetical protein